MNWRKPILKVGLSVTSDIISKLQFAKKLHNSPKDAREEYQKKQLVSLLKHAYLTTDYYYDVFQQSGVKSAEDINHSLIKEIPPLTKEIIRKEENRIISRVKTKTKINTSGGSTGVPIQIYQDNDYNEWRIANKLFFMYLSGKEIGEKEIKLWGSERDILTGSIGIKAKISNYLYNRKLLNSFLMGDKEMYEYINTINKFKPKIIWTYVDSIFELSKFAQKVNIEVYSPETIITTAGVLTEDIRNQVKKTFNSNVINQYGSREVGDIGIELKEKEGLRVFSHTHFLREENQKLYVSLLSNYAMPLINYEIGDTVKMSDFETITKVNGRITDHFINMKGELIHGEYFTHCFYNKKWVNRFQVIQKSKKLILCNIVKVGNVNIEEMNKIKYEIKKVMGNNCEVKFNYLESIEPSPSGKYLYTYSEVNQS